MVYLSLASALGSPKADYAGKHQGQAVEVDFEKGSGTDGVAASGISDDTIGSTLNAAARPCTRRSADAPPALTPSIKPTEIAAAAQPPTRIRASQRIDSAIPPS